VTAEPTPEVAAELVAVRTAADEADRAEIAADAARRNLERAIKAAHPKASLRAIGDAARLSKSRAHQIIRGQS
jgi:hypothetical protein